MDAREGRFALTAAVAWGGSKKQAALLPAYLFVGEDRLKRDALLARMQERVSELGDISLNQTVFEGAEIDPPDSVVSACTTMPFLSEKRLVVVKGIGQAKKPVLDAICSYLETPADTTVLVMTGDKLAKNARIYNAVAKIDPSAVIACDLKTRRSDVRAFAIKLARSMEVSLDQRAADELVERVGVSTVAIDAEMRKLVDYVSSMGRTDISAADVANLVVKSEGPKPWEIVDAMSSRSISRCLDLLAQSDGQQLFGMLTLCTRRIEELLTVKALESRPERQSIASVLGGPDWRYKKHREFASRFTEPELIRALSGAADCEMAMKSGADQTTSLQIWLAGVCTGRWPSASV